MMQVRVFPGISKAQFGLERAEGADALLNLAVQVDGDILVLEHLQLHVFGHGNGSQPVDGMLHQVAKIPAQLASLFHEMHRHAAPRKRQGRRHASDPAADHQRGLVDRQHAHL